MYLLWPITNWRVENLTSPSLHYRNIFLPMKANRSWVRDKLKKLWQWKFVFCLSRAQETSDRAHSKILGSRLFHDELQIDDNNLNRRILAASLFRKRLRLRDEVPSRLRRFPGTRRLTERHPTRRGRVWWRQDLGKEFLWVIFLWWLQFKNQRCHPAIDKTFLSCQPTGDQVIILMKQQRASKQLAPNASSLKLPKSTWLTSSIMLLLS